MAVATITATATTAVRRTVVLASLAPLSSLSSWTRSLLASHQLVRMATINHVWHIPTIGVRPLSTSHQRDDHTSSATDNKMTEMESKLLKRLGVQYPIILAPMAGSSTPELVAAVSNAGGLGQFGGALLSPKQLLETIAKIRTLTSRPFGVNLFMITTPTEPPSIVSVALTHQLLHPLRRTLGLSSPPPPPPHPFTAADFHQSWQPQVEALLTMDHIPQVISFTFGIMPTEVVKAFQKRGCTVIGTATTVEEAKALQATGVDAVCAQGWEAGGHRGTWMAPVDKSAIGLLSLVTCIRDAIAPTPVIAAGGIMDGRGIKAALALGADAAQLGSAYLWTPEVSYNHDALIAAISLLYHGHRTNMPSPYLYDDFLNRLINTNNNNMNYNGGNGNGNNGDVYDRQLDHQMASLSWSSQSSLNPLYRRALSSATDTSTVVTSGWSGRAARGYRNHLSDLLHPFTSPAREGAADGGLFPADFVLPSGYGVMRPLLADIRTAALATVDASSSSTTATTAQSNNGNGTTAAASSSSSSSSSNDNSRNRTGSGNSKINSNDGLNYMPGLLMGQSAGRGRALPAAILTQLLAVEAGFAPVPRSIPTPKAASPNIEFM